MWEMVVGAGIMLVGTLFGAAIAMPKKGKDV